MRVNSRKYGVDDLTRLRGISMQLHSFDHNVLAMPLFDDCHRALAASIDTWCVEQRQGWAKMDQQSSADAGHALIKQLGEAGWFRHLTCKPGSDSNDYRSLCIRRQALAHSADLADFAYSIQELAASVITHYANDAQKSLYLPLFASGNIVGAFATSELHAGSDVGDIQLTARRDGDSYVLDGDKAWIAQGDIADVCIVIARTGKAPGALGLSALLVDMRLPGIEVTPVAAIAPRSWANIRFSRCEIPVTSLIGREGQGFVIAIETLDRFRMTVSAAAIGFGRRAYGFAVCRASQRRAYKGKLMDLQIIKAKLAEMEIKLSASALLVANASWSLDLGRPYAKVSAIAKVFGTEAAYSVVDQAVQIAGAAGLVAGSLTEGLYREVRSLRLYEGATEVLLMSIASSIDFRSSET